MTTDDRAIEAALAGLGLQAPPTLAPAVLVQVGLADRYATIESPIGPLYVAWNGRGVSTVEQTIDDADVRAAPSRTDRSCRLSGGSPPRGPGHAHRPPARRRPTGAGSRRPPRSLAVRARGPPEAAEIPRGEVRPYGWIAAEIGRPKAVRAVGTALGHNPVPFIVPCHRVVRTDGTLGQYSLGGAHNKRAILAWEGLDPDAFERLARSGVHYTGSKTTRIVCHPTCRHARRTMPVHLVGFRSLKAAAEAGYRPCKVCRPASGAAAAA